MINDWINVNPGIMPTYERAGLFEWLEILKVGTPVQNKDSQESWKGS